MSVGTFAFLPNFRAGVAMAAERSGVRLSADYQVQVTGDGAPHGGSVTMDAVLKGPGDVIGISPDQIVRTEPAAGLQGFEPNYFPFLEFRDADFPWRYSLSEGAVPRLRPWVALIALTEDEYEDMPGQGAPAPRIRVGSGAASLPKLGQAWAWAHVQVDMNDAGGASATEVLEAAPHLGFARLLCPRKLEPSTRYTLFVVPVYAAGVRAGLGEVPDAGLGAQLAWADNAGAVELPYYHSWRIRTEPAQDLEALLEKLRAIRADEPAEAGAPRYATSADPGYFEPGAHEPAQIALGAALVQPDTEDGLPENAAPLSLRRAVAGVLNTQIAQQRKDGELEPDKEGEDPLVTFPAYGMHLTEKEAISVSDGARGAWFDRLNLDLSFRQAAGLGAAIVKAEQERFMRLCWEQYEEILAANRALARLQAAQVLAGRLETRHFGRLPSAAALRLAEPIVDYVPLSKGAGSVGGLLRAAGVPRSLSGRAVARVAAKKPRRIEGANAPARAEPALPGDMTPDPGTGSQAGSPLPGVIESLKTNPDAKPMDDVMGQLFNRETLNRRKRPKRPAARVKSFSTAVLHEDIRARLRELPKVKADAVVGGRSPEEKARGGPIYRAPRVPVPLVNPLRRLSRDAILSNVAALPDNTVSAYRENRAFVEAVLAGANHAMNDELRWRGFPTDMRGTVLPRFWDRGADANDESLDDTGPISGWAAPLGENPAPADEDGEQDLVVVIKGEVIRKLDDPLIVVNIAPGTEWEENAGETFAPVTYGKLGPDVVYYGFDVSLDRLRDEDNYHRSFFVIYEPPGRLRFGLDVGSWQVRQARGAVSTVTGAPFSTWDEISWSHVAQTPAGYVGAGAPMDPPPGEPDWWGEDRDAATLARAVLQKPIAAVLPLRKVL